MFHYLYKTTNTITGKVYVGIHSTRDLDDGYLGSGKLLLRALRKYGKSAFTKEILEFFNSREDLDLAEETLVTFDFCKSRQTYNIMPGGAYGSEERNGLSFKGRQH